MLKDVITDKPELRFSLKVIENKIKILQLNDKQVLKDGNKCILILGKQEGHENTYYIKGGFQGMFYVSEDKIIAVDDKMKESFD